YFCFLEYRPVGKIGEGTFSDVLKMLNLRDGKYYACKHMKEHFESIEQVNNLREIQALRRLNPHPNILMLHEVIFDKKAGSLSLICELMDMNIYELIRGMRKPLPEKKIINYMYQLCKSLDHIHRNGIFHRDVKPENILIKQSTLKLGDFGSCRSIYSKQPYTEYISTRWYRAPECLLTDGYYSYKMDMWSAGCVFYEITSLQPLFPGSNELDQISKIHDIVGTPAKKTLNKFKQSRIISFDFPFKKGTGIPPLVPNLSPKGFSLLYAMIKYDPDERIAAHQALQHPYFQELWQVISILKIKKWQGRGRMLHCRPPCADLQNLNLSRVVKLTSYPTPTSYSVLTAPMKSEETPVLQSSVSYPIYLKLLLFPQQSEKQKELKSSLKHSHLPAIQRRGGGY
ncbi:MOK kinase, partial [Nothocercus julius]|nr:MOK kinase [Nothocercus julius]